MPTFNPCLFTNRNSMYVSKTAGAFKKTSCWVIALVLLFCQTSDVFAEKAPKFFLSNLEGTRFYSKHNDDFIISFFFIDCIPCKKEIPQLYSLMTSRGLSVKLLFVDPLTEDTVEKIKLFAGKLNVPIDLFYRDALGNMAKKFMSGELVFLSTRIFD